MNKFWKLIIAVLGAVNIVFNIFIPLAIGLMSISFFNLSPMLSNIVMIVAILSTIYRGIDIGFMNMIR